MSNYIKCPQCNLVRINGIICHELGCPDSWRFTTRECKNCGSTFKPEDNTEFCSPECSDDYYGVINCYPEDDDCYEQFEEEEE